MLVESSAISISISEDTLFMFSILCATLQTKERLLAKTIINHLEETGNSNNLTDIRGQLYHGNDGVKQWDSDIWVTNGANSLPILQFQLLSSANSYPSPTPARVSDAKMSIKPVPLKSFRPLATKKILPVQQRRKRRKRKRNYN